MEPTVAWFCWPSLPHPQEPLRRGWVRPQSKGFSRINKLKEKNNYFYCLSVNDNNCLPVAGNDKAKTALVIADDRPP